MSLHLIEEIIIAIGAVVFVLTGLRYRDEAGKITKGGIGLIIAAAAIAIDLVTWRLFNMGVAIALYILCVTIYDFINKGKIGRFRRIILPLVAVAYLVAKVKSFLAGGDSYSSYILASLCVLVILSNRIKDDGNKRKALPAGIFALGIIAIDIINQILT